MTLWRRIATAALLVSVSTPALAVPVAAFTALGLSTALATVAAIVVNIGLSYLAAQLLKPKIAKTSSSTTVQLGEVPRQAIFGRAATAGSLVDAFNYGGGYGTRWEVAVFAIADHRCKGLVGFYVDDKFVAFAGDGMVAGYDDHLEVHWLPGTEDQVLPSLLTTNGPGWTADDNMAGVAAVVVAYRADPVDDKNRVFAAGRPQFLFIVDGKLCYDPRKDSTVAGGAGTHRWHDPSTYEWTDNPIVARYNWARGVYACDRIDQPEQLLVGRGLTTTEAPPENVAARANVCDELVALRAGGSEKRYRIGAVVNADEEHIDVEEKFAAACGGVIVQPQGAVEIDPGVAKAPISWFTDDDIVVGTSVKFSRFRSEGDDEWCNTVVPKYIEPAQKWGNHAAPIRRVYADVITDGAPRENVHPLTYVTGGTQAQRCGEIDRRMGRLLRTATLTLGPRFAAVEEGDWVVWTSARRTGGQPVTFRVEAYSLDEKWQNTLSLREIAASVFDWHASTDELADGAVATQQVAPDESAAPTGWTLAGTGLSSSGGTMPALVFTGAVPDDIFVSAVKLEYRLDDGSDPGSATDWTDGATWSSTMTRAQITSVAPGSAYYGALSYITAKGTTDRQILGPATVGAVTSASDTLAPPSNFAAADGVGAAGLSWRNPTSSSFYGVRLWRGASSDFDDAGLFADVVGGLGAPGNYTDSMAAGTYYYWAASRTEDGTLSVVVGPLSATIS